MNDAYIVAMHCLSAQQDTFEWQGVIVELARTATELIELPHGDSG